MDPSTQSKVTRSILDCNQCNSQNCRSLVDHESKDRLSNPEIEPSSDNKMSLLSEKSDERWDLNNIDFLRVLLILWFTFLNVSTAEMPPHI